MLPVLHVHLSVEGSAHWSQVDFKNFSLRDVELSLVV